MNEKPEDLKAELLKAARVAGAVPDEDGFWKELAEREAVYDKLAKGLVEPRLPKKA